MTIATARWMDDRYAFLHVVITCTSPSRFITHLRQLQGQARNGDGLLIAIHNGTAICELCLSRVRQRLCGGPSQVESDSVGAACVLLG